MKPQKFESIVTKKEWLSPKVLKLSFKHVVPSALEFIPGQFISLNVGDGKFRAYSICSNCKNSKSLTIIVSASHKGVGANYVKGLKLGDKVNFIGPSGAFCLNKPLPEKIYFFATEAGIAPFIPMFHELIDLGFNGTITLFFGIRYEKNMFFEDLLKEFSHKLAHFTYEIFVSAPDKNCRYNTGRITTVLPNLKTNIDDNFYICGNNSMVDEVKSILTAKGVPSENIFYEKF